MINVMGAVCAFAILDRTLMNFGAAIDVQLSISRVKKRLGVSSSIFASLKQFKSRGTKMRFFSSNVLLYS